MEQIVQTSKKKYKYNRISLNDGADKKLSALLVQVNEHLLGMVKMNKSDMANMVIDEYPNQLSKIQLNRLRENLLTDIQRAKWIVLQLEQARKDGSEVSFDQLVSRTKKHIRKKRTEEIQKSKHTMINNS